MAIGGFSGRDPVIDGAAFARMVRQGQVRFVLLGGPGSYGRSECAEARRRSIAALARRQGAPVDPSLWRSEAPEGDGTPQPRQGARLRLWDLRATPATAVPDVSDP
jgi:hypothetical protein